MGFIKKPSTNDKVHCVVFVINGSKVCSYAKSYGATFQQLREHISNLGELSLKNESYVQHLLPRKAFMTIEMG